MWIDQINADPELAGAGFQVCWCITFGLNKNGDGIWESFLGDVRLAKMAHTTDRWVRTIKQKLVANGHIKIARGKPDRLQPIVLALQDQSTKPEVTSGLIQAKPEVSSPKPEVNDSETGTPFRGSPVKSSGSGRTSVSTSVSKQRERAATTAPAAPDGRAVASAQEREPKGGGKPKAQPMPRNWEPIEETVQYGVGIGMTRAQVDADLQRFKDDRIRCSDYLASFQ
jgi:hypothetical protein